MAINAHSGHKTTDKPSEYREALELAEAGRSDEALACIQEYLASAPNDPEALNDTGVLLFSLGFTDEAVNHLEKARQLFPDSAEIIWNLVEIYLAANKGEKAIELFDVMEQLGILNADVLNRTADVLLKNDNLGGAAKTLRQSLEISPDQEILLPMIDVICGKMTENSC